MTYIALILSVFVGIAIVYGLKPGAKIIQFLLSFSGAYLLSITILHLLPEVFSNDNKSSIGFFILIGLLIQLIIDFFSKGAEHGHIHHQSTGTIPWLLFLSLCVHAFIEGIPLAENRIHLLWAIVIHKIPIAIILATFFINSNISKTFAIIFLFLFALMSPLGNFMGENIQLLIDYKIQITAVTIGIFLHISTIILFETAKDHKFNLYKFIVILFGMLIAYLT